MFILLVGVLIAPLSASAGTPSLRKHVRTLTARDMEGRYPGTEGAKLALSYIEKQMKRSGLKPAGDDGFEVDTELTTALDVDSTLVLGRHVAAPGAEFVVAGFSDTVDSTAKPIFCAYGLSEPGLGWDDYSVDVRGRMVVIVTGVPEQLRSYEHAGRIARPEAKAATALAKGATAVLIVNNPRDFGDSEGQRNDVSPRVTPSDVLEGIAVVRMTHKAFQIGAGAFDLTTALASENPSAKELELELQLDVDVDRSTEESPSLLGMVEGKDKDLAPIVLGAHWDGLGNQMASDGKRSHYEGADDNASGIAVMLDVAAELAKTRPKRTILFAAISGEELGMRGSRRLSRYVQEHFGSGIYINMDMVGRLDERGLRTYGLEGFEKAKAVRKSAKKLGVSLLGLPAYDSESDHISFRETGFNVIGFSTGRHAGYHSVDDRMDSLDWKNMQRIQRFVTSVIVQIAR